MAYGRAKEVSESYKGAEVTFDKTTPGAVSKQFTATDVQTAIVEAKAIDASPTVVGISRASTDPEAAAGSNVNAYVKPYQMLNKIVDYANTVIIPKIPAVPAVPSAVYGGYGTAEQMQATYAALPIGSLVVYEQSYSQAYGTGNGTAYRTAYVRRTLCRTSNSGWLQVIQ